MTTTTSRRPVTTRTAAVLAAVAVLATAATAPDARADDSRQRGPGWHPCATATQRCQGTVRVPLDRADPSQGTHTIGFTFQPAERGVQKAHGTLVGLVGGPIVDNPIDQYDTTHRPLRHHVNLLAFDYRGVGRSSHLYCPGVGIPGDAYPDRAAVRACADQLGDRAQLHGTVNTADDLEAIRTALGLRNLDVLGRSYGTYLAQVYAIRHPHAVRTLTLDSTLPLNTDAVRDDVSAHHWQRTLIARACTPTSRCAKISNPLGQWRTTVARARDGRLPIRVANLLWQHLTMTGSGRADELVAAAAAANRGNTTALSALVADNPVPRPADLPPAPIPTPDDTHVSMAMSLSITCSDYRSPMTSGAPPHRRATELRAAIRRLPADAFAPFSVAEYTTGHPAAFADARLCTDWTAPTGRPDLRIPATGPYPRLPTLLIAGELDTTTTPREAARTATRLGGHLVTIPRAGHTPTTYLPCAAALVSNFVGNGGRGPLPRAQCTG